MTLSHDYAYYGVDSKNIFGYNTGDKDGAKAIAEAVQLADSLVDYSQYDKDGDGKVDMVYVIYAGYGENFALTPIRYGRTNMNCLRPDTTSGSTERRSTRMPVRQNCTAVWARNLAA